jgi:hypothetical protein
MGNLVMPKNSADASEMRKVLEVYNEANDWIDNARFIQKMKEKLGKPYQEPQAYTKKTQIPSYFGFTTWEDPSNNQSRRKITESGKRFLAAIQGGKDDVIFEEILKSLETKTFGRNALGVNSDSDVEPPQIFIKCVLALGYLKRQEFGFILEQLDKGSKNILDLLSIVSVNRLKSSASYEVAPTYADAKPITALVNWNFFRVDGKEGNQEKIILNPKVVEKHINRLQSLRAFNNETLISATLSDDNEDQSEVYTNDKNIIFYGPPGTGKSFQVNKLLESKESRTERVTFHPAFDYSSFVGSYKPTMVDVDGHSSEIRYEFSPQVFTKIYINAWNDLSHDYYLVIEEINRGNCSEIFGDIFQLLDRNSNYPVTPNKELHAYLEKHLGQSSLICADKLKLPPNLSIIATMNTSDQSLFPMDSAFKRRWDWEYVPIDYEVSDSNISSSYVVKLSDDEKFSWIDFIRSVNSIIKNNANLGMDKCIGNYFVKSDSGVIDVKTFINKVVFYLWNDVFKDEVEEDSIFKGGLAYEDFFPIEQGIENLRRVLSVLGVEINNSRETL